EMDKDGKNIRKVTDFQLSDSWISFRKSGSEIIVSPSRKIDSSFYIIDSNGKILQKISTGLKYSNDPCFSPDGKRIVFRGGKQKSKRVEGFDEALYVMDDDGKNLKRITNYPANDTTAPWYAYKAGPPRWHPTDNFISFPSFQNGQYKLYAVTPDGKKQWKLINEGDGSEAYHSWSPDGKFLAFETTDNKETQYDIAIMDWKTKKVEILTDSTYAYEQAPNFVLSN
ncbi:MAG: PD40 domain-containing protein, partial [Ignavibacteriae bacterium]|nr:PD40 domain-containing protein [Ignavibacteriota bacterium]